MAPPLARQLLRFGPFEFDAAAGELYRDGHRVRLQDQPRQVLAALLEHPGEIATREELRDRLWKTDTFVDFEHGLNTAIKKVRQALGDSADAPQYIETLARRGYRFVAAVTREAHSAPAGADAVLPAAGGGTATGRRGHMLGWGLAIALVALVAAALSVTWQKANSRHAPTTGRALPSLAVMPLRILDGPSSTEVSYIGVGIADAIATRLANTKQVAVRPTSAVLRFKDGDADVVRAAATLRVRYLLVGSIQPAEQGYRVSVQLVGADGLAIWGRAYDEPRAALLQLQDRIAEQVASALRVELSPPERARLHLRYTQNPAAYDLYLRGRALLVNYTEGNMREALGYFEQALALDQNYALARAALATGAAWFSVRYAYEADAMTWGKRADAEARRALEQDPHLADAHLAIASAAGTQFGGFNWKVVLDRTAEALELDPSLDLAHVVRMRALYHLGIFEEAAAEAARARALNPFPNAEIARLEVAIQLFAGHFSVAERLASDLLARDRSNLPAVPHYLGLARYYLGDVTGARETLASAMRGGRPDVRAQATLASIEASAGMASQARARLASIVGGSYMDHHVAYSLGAAYAQLRDADTSVTWLQRAADTGFSCYPWFARDPLLAPVRSHSAFITLLDRLRREQERVVSQAQ